MSSETRNGLFVEYCAKDFLDGTQQLDVWEEIAYRRVVDMIYATNDTLADDDRKLAWMTKVGSRWKKIRESLIAAGKIEAVEGRITNAECRDALSRSRMYPWGERRSTYLHAALKEAVWQKTGGLCHYCGEQTYRQVDNRNLRQFTVDHVHPVVFGGTDDIENLAPACRSCNSHKGASLA